MPLPVRRALVAAVLLSVAAQVQIAAQSLPSRIGFVTHREPVRRRVSR